jgi:hypothetical protein
VPQVAEVIHVVKHLQDEIERLQKANTDCMQHYDDARADIKQKDAALRIALSALSDETYVSRYTQITDAINTIKEALK